MASNGTFEMILRGQFRIQVQLPRAPTAGGEDRDDAKDGSQTAACSVAAELTQSFRSSGRSPCTEALLPLIGAYRTVAGKGRGPGRGREQAPWGRGALTRTAHNGEWKYGGCYSR